MLFRRIRDWSDSQLRALYAMIGLLSLCALGLVTLNIIRGSAIQSDDCLWEVSTARGDTVYVVTEVVKGGNADRAGVREGDRVIALDGIRVTGRNVEQAQNILNKARIDRPIPYLVERNGKLLDLRVPLTRQFLYFGLAIPLCAFLWLITGLMVALARPQGVVQRRFFLAAATLIFPFSYPTQFFNAESIGLELLAVAWAASGLAFYVLWFRFCLSFPVMQSFSRKRPDGIWLYLPAIVLGSVLLVSSSLQIASIPLPKLLLIAQNIAVSTIAVSYIGAGMYVLYRGYRQMPQGAGLRSMRVILIGTVVFFLALIYLGVVSASIRGVAILYPQYLLPALLILALPLSYAYAIFKYQVMDFRVVLRTTMVYTSMVVLLAGCYLAIGYGIGQLLASLIREDTRATVQVIAFFLFVIIFEPLKQRVQHAIENRFFPQQRNYTEQLTTYAAEISETVGTAAVAQVMADTLQRVLDLRGVVIVIEQQEERVLRPIARACDFEPVEVSVVAIEHLRRFLLSTHTSFVLLDTAGDPHLNELRAWFPYAAALHAQGRVIGVALLSLPRDGRTLSGSQTSFITSVAAQGAAAVEVARLYEEELQRQRYREELLTARRIQESLLPSRMPDIPGITIDAVSRPAQTVGGDYYDLIVLPDGKFLVLVADVSGKGLPASLYMAEFHGMVRVASSIHGTPKEIFSVLNDHLCQVIARGSFITATMLLFDTVRRTVSYARAGHTPIIRRTGTEVDTLIPAGLGLGLRAGRTFRDTLQEYTVRYEPGETFILYSDGVSEAMNDRFEEFGDGRLLDLVSGASDGTAESICRRMLERVEEFRGGAEQNDDITIVVIHARKDTPEEPAIPESREVLLAR